MMPIHDWTRVFPGTFHHFHCSWITHLSEALNSGLLPDDYYAMAEQDADDVIPDVLTLRRGGVAERNDTGGVLLAEAPPKVSLRMFADEDATYRALRRTIVIRHRSGREIVAMIEIVSHGNKSGRQALAQFVDKSVSALRQGIHLLVVDLYPPSRRDPQGIHGEIWDAISGDFQFPDDRNLTLASYRARNSSPEAFVEPVAVGVSLPNMPLFLSVDRYIETPLETTYQMAYRGMPSPLKEVLEGRLPAESDG